jgi:8-hydroxy-5-deazaflavin:NADPH oxidoreductase
MDVTIVGTGNMGRAIATRLIAGGHTVTLHGTERSKAEALAREIGEGARAGTVGDPIDGDVLVLALWYQAVADALSRYGAGLDGKVVVDITNPVDAETYEPLVLDAGSGAQETAGRAPGAQVVKAFNTTFAGTLAAGEVAGEPLDVLIAGDNEDAKRTVARLVEDGGLRPVDAGPLRRARELEALGILHMAVQPSLGTGYASTVKLLA